MTEILGVDFGTSNTVAVLSRPGAGERPLLFDGTPLLPSAVYADSGGALHTGRDALHLARLDPAALEPNPKRRIDDAVTFLGAGEVPTVALIAAVLRRVAGEAARVAGAVPPVVLTHPAAWGPTRRRALSTAAEQAGLQVFAMVGEPEAAAAYYCTRLDATAPADTVVTVFDLGGGTLDIAVVRRTPSGYTVLGNAGLDDLGGTDIDAVAVHLAGSHLGDGAADTWRRLQRPAAPADLRDRMVLWADVRTAKEMLSRAASAPVPIPGVATGTILTRAELEHAVTPLLARGVEQAATLIDRARIGTAAHRVFLVGGGSRMPLVAQLLHRRLGISPTVTEQPEIAVAAGAALAAAGPAAVTVTERLAATPPAVQAPFPADSVAPGAADDPVPDSRNRRRRRRVVAVIAAVALLAGAVLAWQLLRPPPDDPGDPGGSGAAGTSPASAPPSFDPTSKPAEFTDNAALRAFVQGFDAHLWLDGCRSVADGDPYRIDGRYHNPRAVAPAGAPVEQIHCRSGDFEAHFVRYPRRIDADRVVRAYTVEVTALPRPPEARFGPYDNLWPLPSWGDDQHALLWSDLEQFLVGIMSTSRATTDLQLLWTKYAQ